MSVQKVAIEKLAEIIEKSSSHIQYTYEDVVIHQGDNPEVGAYTLVNTPEGNSYLIR